MVVAAVTVAQGGRGSSGAAGGRGGVVHVGVRDEDTHLLMLLRQGVDGGAGGARGAHGSGGAAGAGGPGGSSHHWTTSETYRDSNGHTQTRTHHHSNPGGSRGPSGSPGSSGSGALADGPRGANGTFTIEVQTRGGAELYEVRYHLALAGLEIHTPDADGITEPGERVELRRVRVTNVGGMPTPRHHDTELVVSLSDWARPIDGARLEVPRGLAPGATAELEGVLPFELRDYATTAESDPLAQAEPIVIDARVPDVSRSFEGFLVPALERARTLTVRFPAALSILEGLSSLAADEVTRLRFAVRNQSRRALGARSADRRRLRVSLRLHESELDDRHATLFDETGVPQLLGGDGFVREIELLESGADHVIELALGVRADAPTYRALRVRLTLEMGRLGEPDALRVVQHRALEVRVAERVGSRPFDWLLVTHHRTTREEVDAWRALAARQGQSIALYDLSLHGDLRLERPFEGGPSLIERARGGLVLLLGYPLHTPEGQTSPTSFLTSELVGAMGEARTDLLVLGGEGSLSDWLSADSVEIDASAELDGTDALFEAIERAHRGPDAAGRGRAHGVRVAVNEVVFGFETPSEERLRARAADVAERLARRFPERAHEVIYTLDPDVTESWAPVRKRRLGWLRILSRSTGRSGAAHLSLDESALRAPETIGGELVASATLVARGVDDRLRALADCLAPTEPDAALASALADALLVSIACEQLAVVRRTRARAGLERAALVHALAALESLARTRLLGPHGVDSKAGDVVVRLAARARFFARAQAALWERIPGLSWARRAGAMIDATDDAVARFFACQSGDPDVARGLADRMRVELEVLDGLWRTARENGQSDKAAFAKVLLLSQVWSSSFTLDEELVLAHRPSVESEEDRARARAERAGAERASSSTAEAIDAERTRLVLPGTTDAWLRRASELELEGDAARVNARARV
jgi:hypothetical protein